MLSDHIVGRPARFLSDDDDDFDSGFEPPAVSWVRDAIFPKDAVALETLRVDVTVSHEAPPSYRLGFVGVDRAARACRARLVVHGHHHEEVFGRLPDGTEVTGLAKAQVLRLSKGDVP